MGMRKRKGEDVDRLKWKTLDGEFRNIVREGLNCSPFEAEAVLDAVKEVYFPFLDESTPVKVPPGKITLVVVSADEPAGKPLADCEKRTVCLTVHRGERDDRLLMEEGARAFRGARIVDLCQEALSQGGLLTREDLASRVFFVSVRTISRDLALLREKDPGIVIPLRSTVHDIGPVLSHRVEVVRLALEGKRMSQICQRLHHSPEAVANYISTFARCAQLSREGMQVGQIAFLLQRGRSLVERYLELLVKCEKDKNMTYHLDELLRLGHIGGKKAKGKRGSHGS